MARFVYNPEVEDRIAVMPGIQRKLKGLADDIVEETRANARMAKSGHRYEPLRVEDGRFSGVEKGAVRVSAHGPFAHIDEWGSINSAPTAAMRRAAGRAGRFEEH